MAVLLIFKTNSNRSTSFRNRTGYQQKIKKTSLKDGVNVFGLFSSHTHQGSIYQTASLIVLHVIKTPQKPRLANVVKG